ncbi:hypothetical protein COCSUDRAFT_47989 [Coccomyxa subellipsoidea C-169]|uniref:Uncharacterized protein n=1 Tax=Coccomyxa subellipsoidea (strain C-169) TaxID=574566 RepID=I0YU54_COCSC|nr:hypothetical protein COCSUDRAFT_47989 [Coccomyxa subellipsoidea C-169]EIE21923.1 hypothetical protein COCSUDRAFT_47989 [Coccomyxa subellipsoidea C-169]|eukprot:XP_005646467.1 hypothetical protein COCSUDRAFT_47989 [Coccomyxa subellipsoidea C-169]
MDGPLAFGNSDLEVGFALQYASQGRKAAVAASVVTTLLAALSLSRCISLAVADGLTPRLALLIAISSVLLCSHAWTLAAVVQPSQVWRHESVKSANSLVGATACMMGSILSHHHELGLKAPVGITCIRGFLVLGETYRLTIALRLHAIQMVCFVIQELDLVLQSSKRTLPDFFKDLAVALVLGKALPILVAAVIEARSRSEFLRARRLPSRHLPPMWKRMVKALPSRLKGN